MLLWVEKIKSKLILMVCHPIMFEILLIFNNNLKFHFYNYEKMFEPHHIMNVKNCKAASYSPLGDKLALGMNGSIWLMDSYSHEIVKKISLVIFPKSILKEQESKESRSSSHRSTVLTALSSKVISKIQYITNEDIVLQTGKKILSVLLNY